MATNKQNKTKKWCNRWILVYEYNNIFLNLYDNSFAHKIANNENQLVDTVLAVGTVS